MAGTIRAPDHLTPAVAPARRAVLALFLAHGIVTASWVARVPLVKERFGLSDAALGLTLFAIAAGSVSALLLAGTLVARFGSRRVTWVAALLFDATVALLAFAPSYVALILLLPLFGAFASTMDVGMNAQAVGVEARAGRPMMSTFHAFWSLGGLVGAGLASALFSRGIGPEALALGLAGTVAAAVLLARGALLPAEIDRRSDAPAFARPPRALLGLGLLAILAMLSEGAIGDWGGVYLRDWLGTSVGLAATGFAAFSLAMTVGRFVGDALRARLAATTLLRGSGVVAASGLGIGLLLDQPAAAIVGFGFVGLGLSNVVPIAFSLAGRVPSVPTGTAIAAVATTGYLGFLVGPPLIGFVAQSTTLPSALAMVACLALLIAASTPRLERT